MDYPELEIGLHRRDTASYAARIHFRDPQEAVDRHAEVYPIQFDFEELLQHGAEPVAYGKLLGKNLLGNQEVQVCLRRARDSAESAERPLRLRLSIDRWSVKLHSLRWETMRDPGAGDSLLTIDQRVLFSRYLGSFDMRPVRLRARSQFRALVVVANPSDLSEFTPSGRPLTPIPVMEELDRARAALGPIPVTELAAPDHVTLNAIARKLGEDFDILYLVCHGALIKGEPRLWLEREDGCAEVVSGLDLLEMLKRLLRLPRLVVLASCQSAGTGQETRDTEEGVLAALGPRLAEAGIPAVVAMQGNIRQSTWAEFMKAFFNELLRDGQIDRAMCEARLAVYRQPDHWMPVLFTRLATGRLWYSFSAFGLMTGTFGSLSISSTRFPLSECGTPLRT
jgi:hypothetical protein